MLKLKKVLEIDNLSRLFSTLKTPNDPTSYFRLGVAIEKSLEYFSNGHLQRVNLTGKDLLGSDKKYYECKKVTFKNKGGMSVRNVIVKNGRGNSDQEFKPADYYIFVEPLKRKACCVPGKMLYNIRQTKTDVKAHCNPKAKHFFMFENDLKGKELPFSYRDFFEEDDKHLYDYIKSFS